jgi:antirestriction protein ArdC
MTTNHEAITKGVIAAIEDGRCPPWGKAWQPDIENSGHPSNIFSMPFTGIAVLLLNMTAAEKRLDSKFWTTQAAWESFGGEVSGEGTLVPLPFTGRG